MTIQVKFCTKAGMQVQGILAEPRGDSRVGGLVVMHEWWGINDQIAQTCERFADVGFLALAPDLYHGKRPETPHHASSLSISLNRDQAMQEIDAAADYLRLHPRCNEKIGVTGFCLGGAFTFGCAIQLPGFAAAVPFYGVPRIPKGEYAKARVPIQAHFARTDDWAKVSDAEEIQRTVRAGGGSMDLFVYEAGHAFMRATDKHVYHQESATLAWGRAVEFLKAHLGG
jgi:carboxymethylenebutenolidase